jgi:hypothetical protein
VERSNHDLFKVPFWNFPRGTEENHKTLSQEKSVSWLIFKLGISKIKAINVTSRANFLHTLEIYATLVKYFFLQKEKSKAIPVPGPGGP